MLISEEAPAAEWLNYRNLKLLYRTQLPSLSKVRKVVIVSCQDAAFMGHIVVACATVFFYFCGMSNGLHYINDILIGCSFEHRRRGNVTAVSTELI